ncbi:DNA-binding helix-turn-helix protein [Catonella morbi ATCC 51271]|uniref:DNA-binding helix-turn-helix protein n=1 Tax=Catonella morbi ATCC 51271 TaxID=592026 RepID=V2Y5X0_9FIRM|nr:helix-turn-helix transcriptional regulator [Catonella morbi]ESL03497.1 DNA-binding helix-turn-helix protein [Catonella morbi ATCC 51271]
MYYNLFLFGERLKSIREKLGLTQKQVVDMAFIDERTLRRMELGKVIPKLETLEALSIIYKTDLVSAIIESRITDYSMLLQTQRNIDLKLINEEMSNFENEFKLIDKLLENIENEYYKILITQFKFFLYGIRYYKNKEYQSALNMYINAIKQTLNDFSLDNYKEYSFSLMEIRILMNIALVEDKCEQDEKYEEILKFCVNQCDENNEMYPRICHNLAGVYRKKEEYSRALLYDNKGIETCKKNIFADTLAVLYYGKAFAEYRLEKTEYKKSLDLSLQLCKIFEQIELMKQIIVNCEDVLGIDMSEYK